MQTSGPKRSLSNLRREFALRQLVPNLTAGLVTGFLCVAVVISLAVLVYAGRLADFLTGGIGLALISTVLVGIVVALFSSLPGMVAATQEAPAAILAVVVASIASALPAGTAPKDLFMTVVAVSALTTLATAACLIALGTFGLGRLVRYLPYPVVGGFLAGTGWLLLAGGIRVMLGAPLSWSHLSGLFAASTLLHWAPGLALAIVIAVVTSRVHHYLVWPLLLGGAAALFYLVMLISGASVNEWRVAGLLLGPFPNTTLLQPIAYADFRHVHWLLVGAQAASAATVIFVSSMSVLFNVSGLELALKRKVDLNQELRAAGFGNLLAGLAGGMVGYQALSFTALNHKVGTGSRLATLVALALVVVTLIFGTPLLAYIPTMVVGGLLAYLGLSFLLSWVYDAFFKLSRLEYAIIWLILLVIASVGFLQGVGVGIIAAVILFVASYSRAEGVKHALSGTSYQSRVRRGREERLYLQAQGDRLFILELQGFIFFGTANGLLERVEKRLGQAPPVRYVLLDFQRVTGLDATALLSFTKLTQLAESGFTLVFTGLTSATSKQLEQNGIAPGERLEIFGTLDEGLEWCETQLLAEASSGLEWQLSLPERIEALGEGLKVLELLDYFERLELTPGHYLMRQGDAPDALYFIESGQVTARFERAGQAPVRLETMRGGSVVGELGFYTGGVRTASVIADEASTVYRLSKEALGRMTQQHPELAAMFHKLLVRLLANRVVHLMTVVEALQR